MNINKQIEKIKQKADKYIRKNHSGYFGNNRYLMSKSDYIYFVEGACNEIKQSILKAIEEVRPDNQDNQHYNEALDDYDNRIFNLLSEAKK